MGRFFYGWANRKNHAALARPEASPELQVILLIHSFRHLPAKEPERHRGYMARQSRNRNHKALYATTQSRPGSGTESQ
jgi:hypothetical protein